MPVKAVVAEDPAAAAEAMRNHGIIFYQNLVNLEKNYRERVEKKD